MSSRNEETALGVARARFVEGLPRKAGELRGAVALLAATPGADRPREEMRRRLHALYASAQVFRIERLAEALRAGIQRLDGARDAGRALDQTDLDHLAELARNLTSLAELPTGTTGLSSVAAPRKASPSLLPPVPPRSSPPPPPPPSRAPVRHPSPSQPVPSAPEREPDGDPVSSHPPRASEPFESLAPPSEPHPPKRRRQGTMRFPAFDPGAAGPPPESSPAPSPAGMIASTPIGEDDDEDEEITTETIVAPPPEVEPPGAPPAEAAAPPSPAESAEDPPAAPRPPEPSPKAPSGSFTAARHTGRFPVPSPAPDRPMGASPQPVASVLVVHDEAVRQQLAALLPEDAFEIVGHPEPEMALRLARSAAPDVVVVASAIALDGETDFIGRLRSDPLTDFVPVVAVVGEDAAEEIDGGVLARAGADAVLRTPLSADATRAAFQRVTHGLTSPGTVPAVGEATPSEIAARLAGEIERGLVGALEVGSTVRVPIGDGSEILAAAWSAISRVRAHVARRSEGAVRYRDTAARGGPALLALVDDDVAAPSQDGEPPGFDPRLEDEVDLRGRRVLVADDDPSVLAFFDGLLEEAGVTVVRARDGGEALDAARRARPDVLVSDILMPRVDGLGVCREVRRDPALADVPVILISWKEDFLQRMRELQAGASGYLRKEASGARILATLRRVLRPRARLETQLRAGSEVRGRLEGIGIVPLLRAVAGEWVDARVVVRDAFHLFEVDLRGGQLADATRTAVDGSFARGASVLPQLLGSTAGRFTATKGRGSHRPTVGGTLDSTLRRAMTSLTSVVDAVSGTALAQAARVEFDEDVVRALLQASPERTGQLVAWLQEGKGPRDLIMEGLVAPQVLESDLVDLARRGAISAVEGPLGEDRIEAARQARERATELAPTAAATDPGRTPAPPEHVAPAMTGVPSSTPPRAAEDEDQVTTASFSHRDVAEAEAEAEASPGASAPPLFSTPAVIPPAEARAADDDPLADPLGLAERDDPTDRSDVEDGAFGPGPAVGAPPATPGDAPGTEDIPEAHPSILEDAEDEPTRVRPSWPTPGEAADADPPKAGGLPATTPDAGEAEPSVVVADEDGLPPLVPSADGEAPSAPPRGDPTQTVGEWSPLEASGSGPAASTTSPPDVPASSPVPSPPPPPPPPSGSATESGVHHPLEDEPSELAAPEAPASTSGEEAVAPAASGAPAATGQVPGTTEVTGKELAQDRPPRRSSAVGFAVLFVTLFAIGFGAMTYLYPYVEPYVDPYVEGVLRPILDSWRGEGDAAPGTGDEAAPDTVTSPAPSTDGPSGGLPGAPASPGDDGAPSAGPATDGAGEGAPAPEETSPADGEGATEPAEPEAAPSDEGAAEEARAPGGPALAWGGRREGVDEVYPGEVGDREGLLVIEPRAGADGPAPRIRVGQRRHGRAPARLALPAGRHEVVFEHGEDEVSYRWVHLRAGETRTVQAP